MVFCLRNTIYKNNGVVSLKIKLKVHGKLFSKLASWKFQFTFSNNNNASKIQNKMYVHLNK